MKLTTLLNKHRGATSLQALSSNFGDGFLLQHNPIFRQIRNQTRALGFTYSDQFNPAYAAFPMGQLEDILNRKVIPYTNNVSPLQSLADRTDLIEWDHVIDNLKPNYIFHESCHAVARSFRPPVSNLQSKITATLIEEAFANTCEFLAIAHAQEPIQRAFLEMNSYFTVFDDRTHLKKAFEKYDFAAIFKLMLLSYVHANFLNESFHETDFKKIIQRAQFKIQPEVKAIKSLAENVFALNPRFRYATNEMYLRLNNITEPVEQVLQFDYLRLIGEDQDLNLFISKLTLCLEKDLS